LPCRLRFFNLKNEMGLVNVVWMGKGILSSLKLLINDLVELFLDNGYSLVARVKLISVDLSDDTNFTKSEIFISDIFLEFESKEVNIVEIKRVKMQNYKAINMLFFHIIENPEHVPLFMILNIIKGNFHLLSLFLERMEFINLGVTYSFNNVRLAFYSPFHHGKIGIIGKNTGIYPYSFSNIEKLVDIDNVNRLVLEIEAMSKLDNFKITTVNVQSNNFLLIKIFSHIVSSSLSARLHIYSLDHKDFTMSLESFPSDRKVYLLDGGEECDGIDSSISFSNHIARVKSVADKILRTAKELKVILVPSCLNQRPSWICCDLTFVINDEDYFTDGNKGLEHELPLRRPRQIERHQPLKVNTRWSDIGGLEKVKKTLKESILDPIEVN
jgi:hypothetical protein